MVLAKPFGKVVSPDGVLSLVVEGTRRSFRLLDPTRVGQAPTCQVRLFGPAVAPIHCEFRRTEGGWIVEAEPSVDAIEINGQSVRRARLEAGDRISIAGVDIEFGSAAAVDGSGERRSADTAESIRESDLQRLAHKFVELDTAAAALEVERNAWSARIESERKCLEEARREWREHWRRAERAVCEERNRLETEAASLRADLDQRLQTIEFREQELRERQSELDAREQAEQESRQRCETEHRAHSDRLLRSEQSARRLLALALTQRQALRDEEQSLHKAKEEWSAHLQQSEQEVAVRKQELAGICDRIARERSLLIQIQRQQSRRMALGLPSPPTPVEPYGIADSISQDAVPYGADAERVAEHLSAWLDELERMIDGIEAADRRTASERARLLHFARYLDVRQRVLGGLGASTTRIAEIERRTEEMERGLRVLNQGRRALDADRSRLAAERAAWIQQRGMDVALRDRERSQMFEQRARLIYKHRQRLARHRRRQEALRVERKNVDARFCQMIRYEARLEALKQELVLQRIGLLSDEIERMKPLDVGSVLPRWDSIHATANSLREQFESAIQRHGARLDRIARILEPDRTSENRRPPRIGDSASRGDKGSAESKVELFLLHAEHEADRRLWDEERRQFEVRIASLEQQVENLAGSLVGAISGRQTQRTVHPQAA